jgi:hypothetical protein
MGGYSNYSAEENAAYAAKTGTVNIGAGREWTEVATKMVAADKNTTEADVRAALGRTPLIIGDDINKRAWAAGYPGRTPTTTGGTEGSFEGRKYSEMKEVTPDGRGNLQYTGRTLDGLKINTDSAGNETFTKPTPAITFEKLDDVIGVKPYATDPSYDKFTQSSKDGGGYTGVGQYRVTQQGITHEGTLYGSPYGAGQLVDRTGRIISSWSEGGGIFVPNMVQQVVATRESDKKRNDNAEVVATNKKPFISALATPPVTQFKPSIQSLIAAGLRVENNTVYKGQTKIGTLSADGIFTKVGSFGAQKPKPKPRVATHIQKPTQKPIKKHVGFMDIFSEAKPTQYIKRGSGLSFENVLVSMRKPAISVKVTVKKPSTKKKDIGFDNAYELLFSNKRRK